ncbi:hypothetical protein [Gudongella oleilytica]|uniref:hypothetical protein n=1 Tax=Gudongella oleilytica TaxID=1582259 RepID=UPI002A35D187|nr:hypothetical protein [Gudongella oleilytica]MDY0257212.1 hypothetical protein [Gudongella oleilytica]
MRKHTRQYFIPVILALSLLLTSCNSSRGSSGVNIKEPITATIGSVDTRIGDLDKDGIQIHIPANALSAENTFTLKLAEGIPENDPSIGTPLGNPIDISIEGDIKRFDEPIEVTFSLSDEQWDSFENPGDIHIGYFDGYSWVYLEPSDIDVENRSVTFSTYHCSLIYPSKAEKEELKRQLAKSIAVENVAVDKKAELRKTTESLVKSVMGPNVDKSFLQDVVEGILDQHDVTQLVKTTANENWTEAGIQLGAVFTQVLASNLWAYAKNADALGDVAANLGLIGSFGTSAAHFENGDFEEAAKELARGIISTHPVGKLFTAAVNVTERQINRWKNAEIEAAYQIFLNGKEPTIPFWGYGSISPGDFNEIWDQMRGVGRQIVIDAVEDFKLENGREPSSEERAQLERDAKATLEKEFRDRKEKEAAIAEAEKKNMEFLNIIDAGNLLVSGRYGYDSDKMSYKDRIRQIFQLRNKVLVDTNRKMNFGGFDSDTELNVYTVEALIKEYVSNGEEAYNEMLVAKGLVEVLDVKSIAGTYTVPIIFSKSSLASEESLAEGKQTISSSASAYPSEAIIEISAEGTVSISYSVSMSSTSSNTIVYNPELTATETSTGNYTVVENYKNIKIAARPGASTQLSDIRGEMTYTGNEVHPHASWETKSDITLSSILKSFTSRVDGSKLTIKVNTEIEMPSSSVGGFSEGFPATFELVLDTK